MIDTFLTGFWFVAGGICGLILTLATMAIIVKAVHELLVLFITIKEKLKGDDDKFISLYKRNRWLYA